MTKKFSAGQKVVLSREGSRELPALRREIGVIIRSVEDEGICVPNCYRVQWGKRNPIVMINHADNLKLSLLTLPTSKRENKV